MIKLMSSCFNAKCVTVGELPLQPLKLNFGEKGKNSNCLWEMASLISGVWL